MKKIGIAGRLREAQLLFSNDLKEGALTQLLIAVAGSARKRYPRDKYTDRKSFTAFLKDEMSNGRFWGPKLCLLVKMPCGGKSLWLEEILYEVLRCNLLHEAMLPATVKREEGVQNKFVLEIDKNGVFVFGDTLLECLFRVVHNAMENTSEFAGKYLPPREQSGVSIGSPGNPLKINTQKLDVPLP